MTVARSVADVLDDHVVFEVESIDRMYLNVWQPRLAYGGGVQGFFVGHRGYHYASTALMDPMTKAFVADIHGFVAARGLELVHFAKGQRKDDLGQQFLAKFTDDEGVLFVGRAQEKAGVWHTQRRYNRSTGGSYAWLVRSSAFINFFYFYCVDADFGPFFLKFSTYFPYTAKLCINGNEWAKRQAAKAGIGFTPLDNGFAAIDDPVDVARLQQICDSLGPEHIDALLRKWLARLPHPFTPGDRRADYRYDISVLQAEFSLTQMLDRPLSGRVFFEEVVRENIDIGRPDRVSLIFDRRLTTRGRHPTPTRFRTRVFTEGVTPSLHVEYKSSRVKQYHKEGRAIRTETTINDSRDFGIGKRLCNLPALRQVGFSTNRRLLAAERIDHDPTIGEEVFTRVAHPAIINGQRVPALRFGDPRVHALLAAVAIARLQPDGFSNRHLRNHLAPLLGIEPGHLTPGRMSYDLRRLRLHGLIERIPTTHRYRPTPLGWRVAVFFTHAYNRFLRTGLAEIADPATNSALHHELNRLATRSGLAA